MYSKDYFALQIKFAKKVAQFKKEPVEDKLLSYTSFFKTFRIPGWRFSSKHPEWVKYLKFVKGNNLVDATYDFYKQSIKDMSVSDHSGNVFGCFSYEYDNIQGDQSIQIHFANYDPSSPGALSKERLPQRMEELRQMFTEIKKRYPQAQRVFGFSWMHNLPSYRRLFPKSYYKNPREIEVWFKSSALWGQFLDSAGELKKDMAKEFLDKLKKVKYTFELRECFKYKVLEPSAPIEDFYKFYKV